MNYKCLHVRFAVGGRGSRVTGVPRSAEAAPPWDPTVGLCLGPYGGPGGGAFPMSEVTM